MRTEELIGALARDAQPVRRLASPWVRLATWLAASLLFAGANVFALGPRGDIADKLIEPRFAIELAAAVATAILAAMAAFSYGVPGRPTWERAIPLFPLAIWVGSLGNGCWQSLMQIGPEGIGFAPDLVCFPYIALGASMPGLLIFWMIRRSAPLAPVRTAMLAALASAALAAATLRLYHTQDASLMVLVWQFGSVAVLSLFGAMIGRGLLRWPRSALKMGG